MFGVRIGYGMVGTEKTEEKIGLTLKSEIPSIVRNPLIITSTSQK
jgi:hypothetical protein